ncbi:LysR substrate-binding domain-containing protein [Yoonia sp. 208BN28-4]|uniref:LysR substrate-binding domain-containing protein n=1 Tax=Yoonia sp. 208BN28-4 TaxID=3126505 RepID=UPI0030A4947E
MSRRHYNLPPLTTLTVFEAAARHLSFKNAAQELSVTPGAVSHQVKSLETELGCALFARHHRGVTLTADGQDLFETLAASFAQVSKELARIRQSTGPETVSVGSTTAVAALWLSQTVVSLWRDHPDLNINQVTQDRPFSRQDGLDFYIRYGKDPDSSLTHTPLYRDELVPVAAPDVAAKLDGCSLSELAQQRLIHLDSPTRSWTTWRDWFGDLGYAGELNLAVRVTSYSVALHMARQGAGIVLGWRRLIAPFLTSGKLAVIAPYDLPAPEKFYLVGRSDDALSKNALILKHWITLGAGDLSV